MASLWLKDVADKAVPSLLVLRSVKVEAPVKGNLTWVCHEDR